MGDVVRPPAFMAPEWGFSFRCEVCREAMIVGDDPARRAVWLAELVKDEGWTETPRGLVCPECSSGAENAGKGKLYLRCRACGWVHFAVIKHGGDCCFRCRVAVNQLQPVKNPALPIGVTVQGILWPPSEPS